MIKSNVQNLTHKQEEVKDVLKMLGLNEGLDQLAKASCVCWYAYVLRGCYWCPFLSRELHFEIEFQRRMGYLRGCKISFMPVWCWRVGCGRGCGLSTWMV